MKSIELDLSKPEYDELFSSQELWQQQSATLLLKHLEYFGLEAKSYKKSSCGPVYGQHVHNAILISGGRGTGKSVFLKNAQALWGEHRKKKQNLPSLYFAPIIDPTLLQDHDSFTNVLVAHIYNQVFDFINSGKSSLSGTELQNQTESFYKRLRSLAEAVQHSGEKSEHSGLDKIIQYSSGIKIDQLFHDYIATAKIILGCDAIVLSIDDVDMALDKAYSVLEEIRRRLSCPDIIPLVSGELELYQHLVKLELRKSLTGYDELYCDRKSNELADAYLTKILPNHYRIALKPISDLLSYLQIKDSKLKTEANKLSYFDYQKKIKQYFFGLVNGEERCADYPLPQSAREVGQLIRLITPSALNDDLSLKHNWECLRGWSESQQHGASHVLACSAIQQLDSFTPFKLSQLLIFNVRDQASKRLPWASYDFCEEQIKLAEPFDKGKGTGTNVNLLKNALNHKVIRSMPPLEMFSDNISITIGNSAVEIERNTLELYTHSAYYGTQGSQQRKVYFSKAFEILATTLLMSVSSVTSCEEWKNKFQEIIDSTPFYSIHALNPTKYVDEAPIAKNSDILEIELNINDNNNFVEKLVQWVNNHKTDIALFVDNETKLLAILAAVFNKAFSQLNLLREGYHKGNNAEDTLLDAILRFRYILINAFGFLLKPNNVVPANLALETSQNILRELSEFSNQSKTYQKNVDWIHEAIKSSIQESEGSLELKSAQFIDAVSRHPIFTELGIDIDNCTTLESAVITNQNGGIRVSQAQESSSSGKFRSKGSVRASSNSKSPIMTFKEQIGAKKTYRTASDFKKAINNGVYKPDHLKTLWEKAEQELGSNPTPDKYQGTHWEIYITLKEKVGK
ncbi:hypothetical protein A6E05_12335 [Aliivibrio sp. 1S165]|uniref:hypothetical protein n=1 Tax=unclassified Aliivibrio TaxID=2645654 RepID=UPI00080DF75E|nr:MULTISPECIES: hypothetical protein [unclassified Aliivibrio]OCH18117.1 hypothetical protein A6E05_12335 [Aliivibrio sp. 1S165]OCH35494.1 hypothetical protein A6E06_13075 [Aliivibrio sp. 1S175]USN27186.1 hypothetical protein [synthetic construct]